MTPVPSAAGQLPDESIEANILADRVRTIAQQAFAITLIAPLGLVCVVFALGPAVSPVRVTAWIALMLLASAFSLGLSRVYLSKPRPAAQTPYWIRWFVLRALLTGGSWGSIAWLLWVPEKFEYQALAMLFVAGVSTVGCIANAALRRCVLAVFCSVWLPTLIQLAYSDHPLHVTLIIVIITFCTFVLVSTLRFSRQLFDATRWRFENAALAETLQREQSRAELASRGKSKFLAAASHDLRQPVHALAFFLQSMRLGAERPEVDRRKLIEITRQAQGTLSGLTSLLDSLLDVSRLEAGTVPTDITNIRLQTMFDLLAQEFGERAASKRIRLRFRPTAVVVKANALGLSRVLSNLIENAIRYTARGTVLVAGRVRRDHVEIQVWDTGSGIPPQELEAIFDEFYQLDNPVRGRERGLGLGLAIVRQLSNLFGHQVTVRSQFERGSMFSIRVPRAESEPAAGEAPARLAKEAKPRSEHEGEAILIIDDNEESLASMREMLDQSGYKVIAATSADAALRLLAANLELSAIIADYRLGHGRNGVEAIDLVRRHTGRQTPAMIITGDTAPERITQVNASGHRVQHKPLAPEVLLRDLSELISGT